MKELSIILNLILVLLLTSNTLSYIPLKEEDVNSHTIQNTNINTDSLESDTKLENFSKKGSKTKSKEKEQNVVLIIGDDMGIETLSAYIDQLNGEDRGFFAITPTLDKFAKNGIKFNRAYAYPVCSATRSAMLTGRYGFRTGMRHPIYPGCPEGLEPPQPTLPRYLPDNVRTAVFGKWHLSPEFEVPTTETIIYSGFEEYEGLLYGAISQYNFTDWEKTDLEGNLSIEEQYFTSYITDKAIEWVQKVQHDGPFFLWLAHVAPHFPLNTPPPNLVYNESVLEEPYDGTNTDPSYNIIYANALIESMDIEIGRLISAMDKDVFERTTFIFLGDNGSDDLISDGHPFTDEYTKMTVYEGGIRVPFFIYNYGVTKPGRTVDSVISVTDIFSTVIELLGGAYTDDYVIDSVSLVPLMENKEKSVRDHTFSEIYGPGYDCTQVDGFINYNYGDAVIEHKYKLLSLYSYSEGDELTLEHQEMYNLLDDPFERSDLLVDGEEALDDEAAEALVRMRQIRQNYLYITT